MKKAKWVALGILPMLAVSPPTMAATTTTGTLTLKDMLKADSVYVIRNLETGQFLRCNANYHDLGTHAAFFGSNIEDNYYFWEFTPSGNGGYYMYNEGRNGYLNDTKTTSTYRGKTDTEPTIVWYIAPNPYNNNGFLISSNDITASESTNTYCLYAYKKNSTYWLCSSEGTPVDEESHFNLVDYYMLPTFRFYTYHQLYQYAKKCGYTASEEKAPAEVEVGDWNDLITFLDAAVTDNVASSETNNDAYVIASRRYHKFLYTDNEGNLHTSDKITTSCIFQSKPSSGGVRTFSNVYHGKDMQFTVYFANNGHATDFRLQNSDGKYLRTDADGNLDYSYLSDAGDLLKYDHEWLITPTPYYKSDDAIPFLDISENDISTKEVEGWYFRIENNKKRIKFIQDPNNSTALETNDEGGYISDVDKAASEQFDGVFGTTIHNADIFSNSVNLRVAANIWHVVLAAATSSGSKDKPIGIVNNFTHNLYYIQNANSGKYIGEPTEGSHLLPLTTDASQKAYFYFEPKTSGHDTGEYAIMLLDKDNSAEKETPKGWLDIADTNDDGTINSDAVPNLTQAALVYREATSRPDATTTDAYNWSLHRARYIDALTATSNYNTFRYVTFYFPFPVQNTDATNVKLFTAQWRKDNHGIILVPVENADIIPANQGVFALVTKDDKHKKIRFKLPDASDVASAATIKDNILKGVVEGEDFVFSKDISSTTRHNASEVYVFSMTEKTGDDTNTSYEDHSLTIGHPADKYLMANRCYIEANEETAKYINSGQALSVSFYSDSTDGITDVASRQQGPRRYFDLQGREVSHPQHGIYITNGKKIYLK